MRMTSDELFERLKEGVREVAREHDLLDETVDVTGKTLTVKEAIGSPHRQDFPLIKGKEKLMQAVVRGAKGQAFTDMPGSFSGTLSEIIERPLETHFDIAVFIATLNAVMRYVGCADKTIHCHDEDPEECAQRIIGRLREEYGDPKIALVGFQPSFLEALSPHFTVRVLDLDDDRIGTEQFGVVVEDGEKDADEVLDWCDLIFATGSTIANGTIVDFIDRGKPAVFYGTTVAGAACLLDLDRYCECAQ